MSSQTIGTKQKEIPCSPIKPAVPLPVPPQQGGYHLRNRIVENKRVVNSRRKEYNAAADKLNKTNIKISKKVFGKKGDKSAKKNILLMFY